MVLLTINVHSQTPQKISYQAIIRNSNGQLVTSHAVDMRISILQGSATGTAVYVETQTPTTNTNGLATIEIGGGIIVSGTFEAIDWTTGIYFIKTQTDPAGGTNYSISGTTQILSVPYAFHSKTAENAVTKSYVDNLIESVKGVLAGYKVIDGDGNIYNSVIKRLTGVRQITEQPTKQDLLHFPVAFARTNLSRSEELVYGGVRRQRSPHGHMQYA